MEIKCSFRLFQALSKCNIMIRKAILFDLDGTLVDTAPDLSAATDHALQQVGRSAVGLAAVRQMVGDGARAMIEKGMIATGGMPAPDIFETAFSAFLTYYSAHPIGRASCRGSVCQYV